MRTVIDVTATGKRRLAVSWAIDRLEGHLGPTWLGSAIDRSEDSFPLALNLLPHHGPALAHTLEWALRLDLCAHLQGWADFRRDLVRDPRPQRLIHSQAQSTLAGLGLKLGWPVVLEPGEPGVPPADIALGPAAELRTEVRVLSESEFGKAQRTVAQDQSDWLMMLGIEGGVWIGGRLDRELTRSERAGLEELLPAVGEGAKPAVLFERPGVSLQVTPRSGGHQARGLRSPVIAEDLTLRFIQAIAGKVKRMRKSGARWLHLTVLTGLWAFTEWGRMDLAPAKIEVMASALEQHLGECRPAGLVLSSSTSMAPGDEDRGIVRSDHGIGIRIPVRPFHAREVLVLGFEQAGVGAVDAWVATIQAERDWLAWGLLGAGLPGTSEIFGGSSGGS